MVFLQCSLSSLFAATSNRFLRFKLSSLATTMRTRMMVNDQSRLSLKISQIQMQVQIIEWDENDQSRMVSENEGGNWLSVKISPIVKVNSTRRLSSWQFSHHRHCCHISSSKNHFLNLEPWKSETICSYDFFQWVHGNWLIFFWAVRGKPKSWSPIRDMVSDSFLTGLQVKSYNL